MSENPIRPTLRANLRGLVQKGYTESTSIDKYIDRVWNTYGEYLRIDASDGSSTISKARFEQTFKSFLRDVDDAYPREEYPNMTLGERLQKALNRYETSSEYSTKKDRLLRYSLNNLLEDPRDRKKFSRMAGINRNNPFAIDKWVYEGDGTTSDGRHYSVNSYSGVFVVTLNSPQETIILKEKQFRESEYAGRMVKYVSKSDDNNRDDTSQ